MKNLLLSYMEFIMLLLKKYKKICLIILSLFFTGQVQTHFLSTMFQTIKDNKYATLMTCSSILLGYISLRLWIKNKSLKHKYKPFEYQNAALMNTINIMQNEISSFLDKIISEEYMRRDDFSSRPATRRVTQEEVKSILSQTSNNVIKRN